MERREIDDRTSTAESKAAHLLHHHRHHHHHHHHHHHQRQAGHSPLFARRSLSVRAELAVTRPQTTFSAAPCNTRPQAADYLTGI